MFQPPFLAVPGTEISDNDFNQPAVILWNPLLSHHFTVEINCPDCGSSCGMKHWNDGSCESQQPRLLHAFDNIVVLVSAVYECMHGHLIFAHDARILDSLPSEVEIPFVLLHRTGFTTQFIEMCNSLVRSGMNFYNIESLIIEKRWAAYACNYNRYKRHVKTRGACTVADFQSSYLSNTPSNSVLTKCFLSKFSTLENLYLREMSSILVGETISFDHTFKVAANIGYYREDRVWVNQYNSLFLVMNANGEVVTWQLTNGTSLDQVQIVLREVYERSRHQEQEIKCIYIDDCCKLRDKIKAIFGSSVEVKLDIFHAVQRITRTLPKFHVLFQQCCSELRSVFRKDGDIGETRKFDTPSPDVMEKKLDLFTSKWKNAQIFRPDTSIAIKNIKKHIIAGCLSNIPPGGGTNRNERFHRHIKSFFNRSKIGIFLAYALLSVIIHYHNSQTKFHHKVIVRPIQASPFVTESKIPQAPVGILPKTHNIPRRDEEEEEWEIDLTDKQMDVELTVAMYSASVQKFILLKSVEHKIADALMNILPLFEPFSPSQMITNFPLENMGINYEDINNQLSQYGLVLSLTSEEGGIGNCFFVSLSKGIFQSPSTWRSILVQKGISDYNSTTLPHKLRLLFVKEITGEKLQHYRCFTTLLEENYQQEASKFLEDGYYDSSVGNLMPLAMSNALQACFVIIRAEEHPLYITPEGCTSHGTIFLVYHSGGSGHYDAAVSCLGTDNGHFTTHIQSTSTVVKCSCGVNSKELRAVCMPQPLYATRCKCYKSGESCSPLCKCKNCQNPHGERVKSSGQANRKRRHPHMLQLDVPSCKKYANERGESINLGIWSKFETLVIMEIVAGLSYSKLSYDTENVRHIFNDIVYYSTTSFCVLPLPDNIVFRSKTYGQIEAKLKHVFREHL